MNRLESIIRDKDTVIAGLKKQLTKAITRLEETGNGAENWNQIDELSKSPHRSNTSRSKSQSASEKLRFLTAQCHSLHKNVKSYESAVEKLTEMRVEEKRE